VALSHQSVALRVPLRYTDAYHNLRLHLELVRRRVQEMRQAGAAGSGDPRSVPEGGSSADRA
jgi:hypothetical protein